MKRYGITLVLIIMWVFTSALPVGAVKLHTVAPDFTLTDLHGVTRSLASQKGMVTILNFWSTTCPPCVAELPSLNELFREQRQNGLMVFGIALDPSIKPVREMVTRLRIEYPIMLDSNKDVYFDSYGLFGQPVSIVIDRKGDVREKLIGSVEWTAPHIRQKLQNYLKER